MFSSLFSIKLKEIAQDPIISSTVKNPPLLIDGV